MTTNPVSIDEPASAVSPVGSPAAASLIAYTTPRLIWLLRGLCAVALTVSGYLAWTAWNSVEVYGCGGELFDCGHVLTSRWSKWFGIPVSMPAFALYASLLAVLTFMRRDAPPALLRLGWQLLTWGGIAAGLAALWFLSLQVFVIQHLCAYCLTAHACGVCLAGIVLWLHPVGWPQTRWLCGLSVSATLVLVVGQCLTPAPQTWVVETFETPADELLEDSAVADQAALFLAPDDMFTPPGSHDDLIAAPGSEAAGADLLTAAAPHASVTDLTQSFSDAPADQHTRGDLATADLAQSAVAKTPESANLTLETVAPDVDSATDPTIGTADQPAVNPQSEEHGAASEIPSAQDARQDSPARAVDSESVPGVRAPRAAAAVLLFFSPTTRASLQLLSGFLTQDQSTADTAAGAASPASPSEVPSAAPTNAAPQADVAVPEPRILAPAGGKFRINAAQWPILGRPDAKYIVVEMFDYTCPHCRNTHRTIQQALRKYGDDLAVITLVVPLNPACNSTSRSSAAQHIDSCELARLSVAVWRVNPEQFPAYHDWLFDGGRNRTAGEARRHAEQLVGREKLQAELQRPTAQEYIGRHVEMYKRVGSGAVPKLLFPRSAMTGEVGSVTAFGQILEREFPAAPQR